MGYIPQQRDLEILKQSTRTVFSKIELLNKEFKKIGELDGELIDDNYSIDSTSDIRNTYNLTLIVKDSSFLVGSDKKIWLNKYIRVYIGLVYLRSKETVWYPVGVYIFKDASYSYNPTTRELSLSCLDRMAEFTGDKNGQLSGVSTTISAGSNIRDAMISTITQLGGVEKYRIEDTREDVPYDLEYSTGSKIYDIIKELRDLYAGWETFFDDEYFICQPYPTCYDDPIVIDSDTLSPLVISEDIKIDFSGIYNVVEVWGKSLETDYFTETVTYTNGIISLTYTALAGLSNGTMIGFKASSDGLAGSSVKIIGANSVIIGTYSIFGERNEELDSSRIISGSSYVLEFVENGVLSYFYFCGQYQIGAVVKVVSEIPSDETMCDDLLNESTSNITYLVKPDSPFACDLDDIGEIRQVLSGGDYDNIYSEDLATQRAKYEVWKSTDLLDTISLELIEIPWLGVNQKIEYKSNTTGETEIYIIKQKQGSSTGSTMTISGVKFQPLYYWTT